MSLLSEKTTGYATATVTGAPTATLRFNLTSVDITMDKDIYWYSVTVAPGTSKRRSL